MNIENNKIIAEFLGANPFKEFVNKEIYSYEMYGIIESIVEDEHSKQFYLPEEMLFDTDWNWLMEVVEKIESFNYDFKILGGCWVVVTDCDTDRNESEEILESFGETKIDTVYNAVVEFIKWHNKQNSTKK